MVENCHHGTRANFRVDSFLCKVGFHPWRLRKLRESLSLIPYLDSNHFFFKKSGFNEFYHTCQSVPTTSQLGSKPIYHEQKNNNDQFD
jgi:hypothetical protein